MICSRISQDLVLLMSSSLGGLFELSLATEQSGLELEVLGNLHAWISNERALSMSFVYLVAIPMELKSMQSHHYLSCVILTAIEWMTCQVCNSEKCRVQGSMPCSISI